MFKWSNTSIDRAKGVNPQLLECATRALKSCKTYDQSVQWLGGLRTAEQQNQIFKSGASQLDGYNKKSYHQTGNAIDICPVGLDLQALDRMVNGRIPLHPGFREFAANMFRQWQKMIREGKADGVLEWGGHWKTFIDCPHWQVK